MLDFDDKDLVIVCSTIIALGCMFKMGNPESILTAIVAGLFGVAVGRKLK